MSTLWSPRTLRKYIDTYQGTTPAEEIASYYFYPANTSLNSSDSRISTPTSLSTISANNYTFFTGNGVSSPTALSYLGNNVTNVSLSSLTRTDWQGTLTLSPSSRTNLLGYGNLSSYYGLINSITYTANYYTDPAGNTTGAQLIATANNGDVAFGGNNTAGANTYTASIWLKYISGSGICTLLCPNGNISKLINVTSNWAKYTFTYYQSGTNSSIITLYLQNSGDIIAAAFGQIEVGLIATGYINTPSNSIVSITDYVVTTSSLILGQIPVSGATLNWTGSGAFLKTDIFSGSASGGIYPAGSTIASINISGSAQGNGNGSLTISGISTGPLTVSGSSSGWNETVSGTTANIPTLRQVYTTNNTNGVSSTMSGISVVAGDLILIPVFTWASSGTTIIDSSSIGSNTYNLITYEEDPQYGHYTNLYYAIANQSATLTIIANNTNGLIISEIAVYYNMNTTTALLGQNAINYSGGVSSFSSGTINTTFPNELVVNIWQSSNANTITDTAGFTVEVQPSSVSNTGLGLTQKTYNTPTSGIVDTITTPSTDYVVSVISGFLPAYTPLSISGQIAGQVYPTGSTPAYTPQLVNIYRTTNASQWTNPTSISGILVNQGNLIVVPVLSSTSSGLTLSDNSSNSYSMIATSGEVGGLNSYIYLFYAIANSTTILTITTGGSSNNTITEVGVYTGITSSSTVDGYSTTADGLSDYTSHTSGSINTTAFNDLVICCWGSTGAVAVTDTAGFTVEVQPNYISTTGVGLNQKVISSPTIGIKDTITNLYAPLASVISGFKALNTQSIIVSGSSNGLVNTITGTSSDSLSISGQILGNTSNFVGYSSDNLSISGQIIGTFTFTGFSGTSNGSLSISGQATGTFTSLISGTSNASISISGQVVGALGETGISNGALSITGQGIGNRGESGTSTGSLSLSGQVVGVLGESGTSNASISISGQVVGALGNTASSNALSLSITGAASGNWFSGVSGISNGSISITGSSNGNIIDYIGTSNGSLYITGNINAAIKIIGTSSNTLNITGSSTGSIIDYVGTSNGSLLLSGQVIGNRGVNVLSSNNALNIIGSANGNLIDYIGTSNAILSITGNINAVRGVNVLSSNNTIAITGSSNGNIIDYRGTSNGALSITGTINAVRGVVASSIGKALSLAGFVYANIGNGGHSNGSISITAVSSGNVINFIGGSSNTLPIITGSGNGALGNNASSNDTLFITGSITGYFIPPVLGSSSASLPSISGQITAYLVSAGYSNCYIFITGSSEGLTAGTYVEVNWTYVVNPPARSWVAEEPIIIYLMNPKARSWIVSSEITRNFIVNPPSRSFNVLTVI